MHMRSHTTADDLGEVIDRVLGAPLPLGLRAWDGSHAGSDGGPTVVVNDPKALRRLVWSPNELGLGRAYVAGELDVDGDLFEALDAFLGVTDAQETPPRLTVARRLELLRDAARLHALGLPPTPPPEEARHGHGVRHSRSRDAAAISHHYDVGNDFYRLVLGSSMVYSCAYWAGVGDDSAPPEPGEIRGDAGEDGGYGLADAQHDKLELVSRKLDLQPGTRLLDVGCGWGSMVIHAAREHGVHAVGVTISQEQADLARKRVAEAGLEHLVEIRVQDYRDVTDGPYDAISSIGMAEHVGRAQLGVYAAGLMSLLRPGGRLLHHAISTRKAPGTGGVRSFIDSYVFPDGELLRVGDTVTVLEEAGLEVRDVQSLREHYGLTLRAWVRNLEGRWDDAVELVGDARARVWRIYMTGSAIAFEAGRIGVDQVLAVRTDHGLSGVPLSRERWLTAG